MNINGVKSEYRLGRWAGIIKERNESGLTVKAYCENIGVHENTYYYWLKKLRNAACEGIMETTGHTGTLPSPVFAEYKLPMQMVSPSFGDVHQSHVCVEAAGLRITAGGEYPCDKLAELLKAVIQAC
jgi:hypothetical protein